MEAKQNSKFTEGLLFKSSNTQSLSSEQDHKAGDEYKRQNFREWNTILADINKEQRYRCGEEVERSMRWPISDFAVFMDAYKGDMAQKHPGFTIEYKFNPPSRYGAASHEPIDLFGLRNSRFLYLSLEGLCILRMEDGRKLIERSPIFFNVRRAGDSIDFTAQYFHPAFSMAFNRLVTKLDNHQQMIVGSIEPKPGASVVGSNASQPPPLPLGANPAQSAELAEVNRIIAEANFTPADFTDRFAAPAPGGKRRRNRPFGGGRSYADILKIGVDWVCNQKLGRLVQLSKKEFCHEKDIHPSTLRNYVTHLRKYIEGEYQEGRHPL